MERNRLVPVNYTDKNGERKTYHISLKGSSQHKRKSNNLFVRNSKRFLVGAGIALTLGIVGNNYLTKSGFEDEKVNSSHVSPVNVPSTNSSNLEDYIESSKPEQTGDVLKDSKTYPISSVHKPTKTLSNPDSLENQINLNTQKLSSDYNERGITNIFNELTAYDDYISNASIETGLDKELLYSFFAVECGGKPRANSHAGARGIAQFMEGTARDMGLKINEVIDERYDPKKSILAGAKYLKKCDMFGDENLMLMAYNYGPYGLKKIIKKHGRDMAVLEKYLPSETFNYPIKIKSRKRKLEEGLNLVPKRLFSKELMQSQKYLIQSGDTLNNISKDNGVKVEDIKRLNPQIIDYNKITPGMHINL